jgi:hypothetical protein
MLLWKYFLDKSFVDAVIAQSELQNFWALLLSLVTEQDKRIESAATLNPERIDAFNLIRTLYQKKVFRLAKSKKRYDEEPSKFDGLIHKDLLCLQSDSLIKVFKNMGYSNNHYDIRSSLKSNKALKVDREGKNYRIGSTRFYGIFIDKLK